MMEEKKEIVKKEYMNSNLESIFVPENVTMIGDWAFANCKRLREIGLPKGLTKLSSNCFYGCDALERVIVYGEDKMPCPVLPELIASSIKLWNMDIAKWIELSSDPRAFYSHFDWRMSVYAKEPDDTGYVPFIAGGEEDYEGDEYDHESFMKNRSEEKCFAMYLRLISDKSEDNTPEYITDYLNAHNPFGAFSIIVAADHFKREMFDIYTDLGLLRDEVLDELLKLTEDDPELKTRILRYSDSDSGSFFDDMNL